MQFVLVNERMPRGFSVCACCRQQFGEGYLREIASNQVYCGYQCYRDSRGAGDWSFDRSGRLVQSNTVAGAGGLYADWAAPSGLC
jgi:hypothetical protein